MTLNQWFKKFHNRPLKIVATFLFAIWFVFALRSYFVIVDKHREATNQAGDLLTLSLQSKDLVMTESLLQILLSQGGATSAAVCKGNQQMIGINDDLFSCGSKVLPIDKVIEKKLVGTGGLVLKVKFNMLASLSPIFSVLGFGLLLVFAGFYFIQVVQNKIEKDILTPLLNNLLSDEKLEINELTDLRARIIHAQELEAQKAVTLAIQENNKQVAHDVRSPVGSINELLKRVEIRDPRLEKALGIAIARANSVANSLLSTEVQKVDVEKLPTYDISEVLQNIATEKMPLFVGGVIEVQSPKQVYIATALHENSLARVLSNIVDNAVLACEDVRRIEISLRREVDEILVEIRDTGRGIPAELINRIGEKGFSFRDKSQSLGSGRGVYSAKNTLTKIGGSIKFESTPGIGTKVSVRIPAKKPEPLGDVDFILVDNEKAVQLTWELGASDSGQSCKVFSSIDELLINAESIPKATPIFLDSDLGSGIKGQDFAPLLREMGFQRILLATSYEDLHGTAIRDVDAVVGKSFISALSLVKQNSLAQIVGVY